MIISDDYGNAYGASNPVPITVTGSLPKEPFSGSTNALHTFTQAMNGFHIENKGISDLTFTIGTDTYTVSGGQVWEYPMSVFMEVTITTTVPYMAWGLI